MKIARTILRIGFLTILYFVCFVIPAMLIPLQEDLRRQMEATAGSQEWALIVAGFCLVAAVCVSYPIRRASWHGVPLTLGMTSAVFGLITFMAQIETFYFRHAFPSLSPEEIANIMLRGLLTAILFVPCAVALNGRLRGMPEEPPGAGLVDIPWNQWAWRIPILAVVYVILYFGFGYYVAWQFPQVRQFYTGSTAIAPLGEHLARTLSDVPLFLPFQFLRGVLWIVFAVPLLLMLSGQRRATITSTALLFGLCGLQIVIPNPLFPDVVRYAHFIETTSSTALYGALIGGILSVPPVSSTNERSMSPA
jgi:hypothetical protein